jgi:hypothetical protein
MSGLDEFSRVAYRVARASRDAKAYSSGDPVKIAKRVGRKAVWRTVAKGLRRLGV